MKLFFLVLLVAILASVDSVFAKAPNPNKKCIKGKQFVYYTPISGSICLKYGGLKNPPKPPVYKFCPKLYQWHKYFKICVPKFPPKDTTPPKCALGRKWDKKHQCCWKYNPTLPPKSSKTTTVTGPTSTGYAVAPKNPVGVSPIKLVQPFKVFWGRDET